MIYSQNDLINSIFIQIETKSKDWNTLPSKEQEIWKHRFHERFKSYGDTPAQSYSFCGKYIAEYSDLISFSIGVFQLNSKKEIEMSHDIIPGEEIDLIAGIEKILHNASGNILSGWNIINWQVPYLVKKFIKHKTKIPFLLDIKNKKPWEVNMNDVMRDYQGNFFGEIDLDLVASDLGVAFKATKIELILCIAQKMMK